MHGGESGSSTSHGTNVHGIVFGDGTANPQWRGVLPRGSQIFADSDSFGWLNNTNPTNRANHTAELVDPSGPYKGLFQTNSHRQRARSRPTRRSRPTWTRSCSTTTWSSRQSQSNLDSQLSRPEAWGKNMISVGGINHEDTLTKADDNWGGASIGPAEDGRIKPDLAHFYDDVGHAEQRVQHLLRRRLRRNLGRHALHDLALRPVLPDVAQRRLVQRPDRHDALREQAALRDRPGGDDQHLDPLELHRHDGQPDARAPGLRRASTSTTSTSSATRPSGATAR